ncbi:MAG TPA: hypothetical protein VFW98_08805 [Gemmatimonadaceae bacterium]|nr:hypothetical protein [Gemmatimonadaceae bacterium]
MPTSAVLVIAHDVVIGALLASLAELAGHTPVFPKVTEAPLDAITRLRPAFVLLDCDHDIACEDEAYARAAQAGSTVILFSGMRSEREVAAMAAERGLASFSFPIQLRDFTRKVGEARQPPDTPPLPSHRP